MRSMTGYASCTFENDIFKLSIEMKSVNNKVTYLKRMAFGKMELGDLVEGEIKEITLKNLI